MSILNTKNRIISEQNFKLKNPLHLDMEKDNDINGLNKKKGGRLYEKIKKIRKNKREVLSKENSTPVEPTTTERKTLDILKESKNSLNNEKDNDNNNDKESQNNTSVDMRTSYGGEDIDIRTVYSFKISNSSFKCLYNKKQDNSESISKQIKNLEKTHSEITPIGDKNSKNDTPFEDNTNYQNDKSITPNEDKISKNEKDITSIKEKSNEKDKNNYEEGGNSKKDIDTIEIQPININNTYNTINYDDNFSFNENNNNSKSICFKEMMLYKDREFQNNYELNENNEIFQTKIIYKDKECILLLNRQFLYILETKEKEQKKSKTKNNEYNPDLSLINNLQNNLSLSDININNLKLTYELSHPLLCLNFNLLSCKILLNKKNSDKNSNNFEIKILILGTSTTIKFYIQNNEIYQKFIYILGSKIYNSEGYKINKLGLSLRTKDFYKDTYITCRDFESMTKTGDLLLFRTLDCISDCQRIFTRDQYDHIALVIIRNGFIELLEATSTDKCNLLEWHKFKYRLYNLVFKKIVLRRLNIEEDDPNKLREIEDKIEKKSNDFIEMINKKDYVMSIPKMLFERKPEEYEVKGEWDKAEGFCCSALTAAFYIYNGIMKLEKSVHCIRPGDFEQDKNRLTVLPGYSFGPEKILEFSDDLKIK